MAAGAGNAGTAGAASDTTSYDRVAWLVVVFAITTLSLVIGFAVKYSCVHALRAGGPGWQGQQYSQNCYSDITALYGVREFNQGHPLAYRDVDLEYPALTGLYVSAVNAPIPNACEPGGSGWCGTRGFFLANSVGLLPFAFAGAAALAAIAARRWRILLFAGLAPALLAYGFHNWDLIPVGLTALAFWAFARRRDGLAGVLLGLGAAAKLYPAFIVPALLLARMRDRESGAAGRLFVGSVAGFLVPNLFVLVTAGFDGWWHPWKFQTERFPNYETSWYFIFRHLGADGGSYWADTYPKVAQWTSTMLFLVAGGLLLWREMRRDRFRPFVAAMGMVLLFLITAKVFSPQYALWLLPFFVLVGIPWWGYLLFAAADMFVLGGIWAYLITQQYPGQFGAPAGVACSAFAACAESADHRLNVLEIAVWTRYAVLLLLVWLSRRAPEHVDAGPRPVAALDAPAAPSAPLPAG